MASNGSGTAGGPVNLHFDMAAAISAGLAGLKELGLSNNNGGGRGGDTNITINQTVNAPVTETGGGGSDAGMDPTLLAALAASAERLEQGMSQLVAYAGREAEGTSTYRAFDRELKSLQKNSDEFYDYAKGTALSQQELDNLNAAFAHKGSFSSWINGELKEVGDALRGGGLGHTKASRAEVEAIRSSAEMAQNAGTMTDFMHSAMKTMGLLDGLKYDVGSRLQSRSNMSYSEALEARRQQREASATQRAADKAAREAEAVRQEQHNEARQTAAADRRAEHTTRQEQQNQTSTGDTTIKSKGDVKVESNQPVTVQGGGNEGQSKGKESVKGAERHGLVNDAAQAAAKEVAASGSGGKPNSSGGGGSGGTPPVLPNNGGSGGGASGSAKYLNSLDELTKLLNDNGLGEVAGQVKNQLANLKSSADDLRGSTPTSIAASFNEDGSLKEFSLQAKSITLGDVDTARMSYNVKEGSLQTHTVASQAGLDKFTRQLAADQQSAERSMNTWFGHQALQSRDASGRNDMRDQLESFLQGGQLGFIDANGQVHLGHRNAATGKISSLTRSELNGLQDNLKQFDATFSDMNKRLGQDFAPRQIDKIDQNYRDMVNRSGSLAQQLWDKAGIDVNDKNATFSNGQNVNAAFQQIEGAIQSFQQNAGNVSKQVDALSTLQRLVGETANNVAETGRIATADLKQARQDVRLGDVQSAAQQALGAEGAQHQVAQVNALTDALKALGDAKSPAEVFKGIDDVVKKTSDLTKQTKAYNEAAGKATAAYEAARANDLYQDVPSAQRQAVEAAATSFANSGTQENLQNFQSAVSAVEASLKSIGEANYWEKQQQQLERYAENLDQLASRNGGLNQWTQRQKDAYQAIQDMELQMGIGIARKNQTDTNNASDAVKTMKADLEKSLNDSKKLIDDYNKTTGNGLFKGVGNQLKTELETALNNFKADGSVASANALSNALTNVKTAMDDIKQSDTFKIQEQQLNSLASKMNAMGAKNGGLDKMTPSQQAMFQNMQMSYASLMQMQGHTVSAGMALPGGGTMTPEMMMAMPQFGTFNTGMRVANAQATQFNNSLRAMVPTTSSLNTQVDALSKYLMNMAAPMMMWRRFSSAMKKAASNVAAIDTQMADLRKVTSNTDAEYQQFLTSSGQNAVAIGAKISDLVATTSTFAHMGYSLTESQALGVSATKFANVGNFQNTTEAADAMIAVIKGFDELNIGDADLVGDKLTAVANSYAVTANDIAEGLSKSASSLNVAGNNVDQATAMITTIAEVTRDAGAAGSALKVLSMRIRGAKAELEDAGESTDGMASSTSKMRESIKALTNVTGKGGVDIMADEDTFRSTYDIMNDIAGVWGNMSDINQSALLELLAGKVRSNQVASLLQNFDQARRVLETSQNAAGTMNAVHQAWMNSVDARKAQFEAAKETLSMTAMPQETLKGLYQAGTNALGWLNLLMQGTGSLGTAAGVFGVTTALRSGGGNIAAGLGNILGLHRNAGSFLGLSRANADWINAYNAAYQTPGATYGKRQESYDAATEAMRRQAEAAGRTAKPLDKYTENLYKQSNGVIDATKATSGLGSAIKSVAKNALTGIATFAAIEGTMALINAALNAVESARPEALRAQADAAYTSMQAAQKEADAISEQRATAQERITELETKGQTSVLTTGEQSELMELRSQMRTLQYQQSVAEAQAKGDAVDTMRQLAAAGVAQAGTQKTADKVLQTTETAQQDFTDAYEALTTAISNAHKELDALDSIEGRELTEAEAARYAQLNSDLQLMGFTGGYYPMSTTSSRAAAMAALAGESNQARREAVSRNLQQGQAPSVMEQSVAANFAQRLSNRTQQLVEQNVDPAIATIQARAELISELSDQMQGGDMDDAALFQSARLLSEQVDLVTDEIVATNGQAAAELADSSKAFTQISEKYDAGRSAAANRLDELGTTAQKWVDSYVKAGGTTNETFRSQMASSLQAYLSGYEQFSEEGTYDAVKGLFKNNAWKEAITQLEELALSSELTGEDIANLKVDGIENAGAKLQDIMGLFGISLNDLASMIEQRTVDAKPSGDGGTGGGKTGPTLASYDSIRGALEGASAAEDYAAKIWKAQGFGGGLDMYSKDFTELMAIDDGAYRAAIQYANGGLFFNKDVFDNLVRQKYTEELSSLRKNVADTQAKYADAAKKVVDQASKFGTDASGSDAYSESLQAMGNYADQLRGYSEMQAQINYATSDYANWLRSQGGAESGDVYDELGAAALAISEGKKSGKIGTREFAAAMRYLTGQDFAENQGVAGLSKASWDYIAGLSALDDKGKPDEAKRKQALFRIAEDMKKAGILNKDGSVALNEDGSPMLLSQMAKTFNAKYGTDFQGEFFNGIFMGLNDYIEKAEDKYQISGYAGSATDQALLDARNDFAAAIKQWDASKSAEDLQKVVEKGNAMTEAYLKAQMKNGTPEQQLAAAQQLSAMQAGEESGDVTGDPLSVAIDGLSATLAGLQSFLEKQAGVDDEKKEGAGSDSNSGDTSQDRNAVGSVVDLEEEGELVDIVDVANKTIEDVDDNAASTLETVQQETQDSLSVLGDQISTLKENYPEVDTSQIDSQYQQLMDDVENGVGDTLNIQEEIAGLEEVVTETMTTAVQEEVATLVETAEGILRETEFGNESLKQSLEAVQSISPDEIVTENATELVASLAAELEAATEEIREVGLSTLEETSELVAETSSAGNQDLYQAGADLKEAIDSGAGLSELVEATDAYNQQLKHQELGEQLGDLFQQIHDFISDNPNYDPSELEHQRDMLKDAYDNGEDVNDDFYETLAGLEALFQDSQVQAAEQNQQENAAVESMVALGEQIDDLKTNHPNADTSQLDAQYQQLMKELLNGEYKSDNFLEEVAGLEEAVTNAAQAAAQEEVAALVETTEGFLQETGFESEGLKQSLEAVKDIPADEIGTENADEIVATLTAELDAAAEKLKDLATGTLEATEDLVTDTSSTGNQELYQAGAELHEAVESGTLVELSDTLDAYNQALQHEETRSQLEDLSKQIHDFQQEHPTYDTTGLENMRDQLWDAFENGEDVNSDFAEALAGVETALTDAQKEAAYNEAMSLVDQANELLGSYNDTDLQRAADAVNDLVNEDVGLTDNFTETVAGLEEALGNAQAGAKAAEQERQQRAAETQKLRAALDELNAQVDEYSKSETGDSTSEDFTAAESEMVDQLFDLTSATGVEDPEQLRQNLEQAQQLFSDLQQSVNQTFEQRQAQRAGMDAAAVRAVMDKAGGELQDAYDKAANAYDRGDWEAFEGYLADFNEQVSDAFQAQIQAEATRMAANKAAQESAQKLLDDDELIANALDALANGDSSLFDLYNQLDTATHDVDANADTINGLAADLQAANEQYSQEHGRNLAAEAQDLISQIEEMGESENNTLSSLKSELQSVVNGEGSLEDRGNTLAGVADALQREQNRLAREWAEGVADGLQDLARQTGDAEYARMGDNIRQAIGEGDFGDNFVEMVTGAEETLAAGTEQVREAVQEQIKSANALIDANADLIEATGPGTAIGDAYEALMTAMNAPGADINTLQTRMAELQGALTAYTEAQQESAAGGLSVAQQPIQAETIQIENSGNIDLNARNKISAAQMQAAGWSDFPSDAYATLYSGAFNSDGKTVLATPITSAGEVLSPEEYTSYIQQLFDGAETLADLFNADNPANGGRGLLIAGAQGDSQEVVAAIGQYGVDLHEAQAELYGSIDERFDAWDLNGMDVTTRSVGADGLEYSVDQIGEYLDGLVANGVNTVEDLLSADNPANGGLGLVTDASYLETAAAMGSSFKDMDAALSAMADLSSEVSAFGEAHNLTEDQQNQLSEISASLNQEYASLQEATQAYDNATNAMNELTAAVTTNEQINGLQQTQPSETGGISETAVDTVTSASVEPEIPGRQQEVNVETKNTTISTPTGSLGISRDLRNEAISAQTGLEDMLDNGARLNGTALSDSEMQTVGNALASLSAALKGEDATALTEAINTADQIMRGNIATGTQTTPEPATTGSGSGGGGGGTVETQTIQTTVETPEIPTPDVPAVQIPVEVESAEVPTPDAPSVTIPVSYSGPGELSIPSPGGVTIPVSWGDPGPMPTGGGGGGGSTYTFSGTMAAASGTEHSVAGRYLVDERGAELIEHVSKGTYEMGTNSGARFTKLDAGDIVHNAKETKRILGRGGATHGTAFANASDAGIGGSRQVKAEVSAKPTKVDVVPAFSVEVTFSGSSSKSGSDASVTGGTTNKTGYSFDAEKWRIDSIKKAMEEAEKQAAKATRYSDSKSSESTGIGKDFLEWLKKLIDWIPTYLSVLKKKTTAFINATDDAIHYLSKNQLIDDAINNVSEEIKANIQATLRYADFLKTMEGKGISSNIAEKVRNGTIDISEYGDEDTVKSIQAYQEYWNKLVACREALQSLNAQMEALSKQKLDNVIDYFDRIDGLLRDQQKTFESLLDMKKQYGQELKAGDYTQSMGVLEQMLANARTEEETLINELKDQLGVDGELVKAILAGGREVWDAISEHVKKNTYNGIVDELLPAAEEAEKAVEEERKALITQAQSTKKSQNFRISQNGTVIKVIGTGKTLKELQDESNAKVAAAEAATDETPYNDKDFSTVDVPVEPITDEEIIELGEKLGLVMADGSEEALANFETIKNMLTTSWEHPLAIGSDTWYEYMSTLENLRESIYSTQTEIGELKDEMADIPLTNLKTGFAYLENIRQNLEDTNSLLDAQGSSKYPDTFRSLISVGMKQIENLQEQNKLIQEQMDSLDPLSEKYQELRSSLNGNLDTIADIRKNQEEWNDEIIDLQIDRLRKQNETYKEQLRLMQALDDLEDARQRRLLVYHDEGGFRYETDEDALEDAQEAANDAIYSSLISGLEKAKENSNIYGPLGERLISGNSIVDSLGNTLVPVTDKLSGLNFEPYYQSIVAGAEQSGLLTSMLNSIDMAKLLEASIGGDVNIDISGMTLNEVNSVKELGDAIIDQLPGYLMQALYQKGA